MGSGLLKDPFHHEPCGSLGHAQLFRGGGQFETFVRESRQAAFRRSQAEEGSQRCRARRGLSGRIAKKDEGAGASPGKSPPRMERGYSDSQGR